MKSHLEVLSLREFLQQADSQRAKKVARLKQSKRVGWQFLSGKKVLVYHLNGRDTYEVDLERCNTSAEILDWLCQVQSKNWCSSWCLAQLLAALDLLSGGLQSNVCSFGRDMPFNMAHALKHGLKEDDEVGLVGNSILNVIPVKELA